MNNGSVTLGLEQEFITILCDRCGREFVLLNIHRHRGEEEELAQIIPAKWADYCPWCGGRREP